MLPESSLSCVNDPAASARLNTSSVAPVIRLAVTVAPDFSCAGFIRSYTNDVPAGLVVRRPKASYCRLTPFNVARWFRASQVKLLVPSKSMLPLAS